VTGEYPIDIKRTPTGGPRIVCGAVCLLERGLRPTAWREPFLTAVSAYPSRAKAGRLADQPDDRGSAVAGFRSAQALWQSTPPETHGIASSATAYFAVAFMSPKLAVEFACTLRLQADA
jgi:hypothetical protein